MNLLGITTSVNYSDYLEKSIPIWKANLSRVLVITTLADILTQDLANHYLCDVLTTDVFYEKGAHFNKGAAISQGFNHLERHAEAEHTDPLDWILFFDADIIPPITLRHDIETANIQPGRLYGVQRVHENGSRIPDGEIAGCFQLFHVSDKNAQQRPIVDTCWNNASCYDSAFERRWNHNEKEFLPITVIHQGEQGKNWAGRGNDAAMQKLLSERRTRGGWKHERIDQ